MRMAHPVLRIPLPLPLRESDHCVVAAVARDVRGGRARETLPRVHEGCFDEGGPRRACGVLERSRPLARDGVNDVRAGNGVLKIGAGHERSRKDAVQCRADAPAAYREKEKTNALMS